MADDVGYTPGVGASVGADEIAGVLYQRLKLIIGADGVNDGDVSAANPLPVSAASLPLPSGAATELTLATLAALAAGAATEATLALIRAKTDNLDVALSTRLKAADTLAAVTNLAQLGGQAVTMGSGVRTAGTQRVTVATDDSVPVTNANLDATLSTRAADATLTGGTAKAIARGGQKGATNTNADITHTASGANHELLDVAIYDAAGNLKDPTQVRALTSADVVTAAQGTAAATAGAWPAKLTDGTNVQAVKAASTAAAATDPSSVTQLSPNQPQLTTPLNTQGGKTNNSAAPGATNIGALTGIANASLPTYTEGNLVIPVTDLRGVWRVNAVPIDFLGVYRWRGITGTYTGLASGAPLWAWRWGDATRFGVILRVRILVFTSTAATTAGLTERWLRVCRSFTASDTAGTAATLTGNNCKLRTSMPTTLLTDMRIGTLTAGTRTLDTAPHASAAGWSGLLSTGVVIGASGSSAVGAARSTEGGGQFVTLFDATTGQESPLIFAQNEGVEVQIGAAMPAAAVQQTLVEVTWGEANKVY